MGPVLSPVVSHWVHLPNMKIPHQPLLSVCGLTENFYPFNYTSVYFIRFQFAQQSPVRYFIECLFKVSVHSDRQWREGVRSRDICVAPFCENSPIKRLEWQELMRYHIVYLSPTRLSYSAFTPTSFSCVCLCLSVCPRSNRKMAWAINTKRGAHIHYSSRSACIDSDVKRSKVTVMKTVTMHGC